MPAAQHDLADANPGKGARQPQPGRLTDDDRAISRSGFGVLLAKLFEAGADIRGVAEEAEFHPRAGSQAACYHRAGVEAYA